MSWPNLYGSLSAEPMPLALAYPFDPGGLYENSSRVVINGGRVLYRDFTAVRPLQEGSRYREFVIRSLDELQARYEAFPCDELRDEIQYTLDLHGLERFPK